MIEPTVQTVAPAPPPADHWLTRAFTAVFVERRLPYRVSVWMDRVANRLGFRRKTVRAAEFVVRVRRQTCDEEFVQNIILNHEYTPPGFTVGKDDVVIDIGGNIGTFALLAARDAAHGRVFTFEPNLENFELLRHNLSINRIANVSAVRAAVAAGAGSVKLFTAPQGGFHSILSDRAVAAEQYELVESVGLKDIFDTHRIDRCNFLKIDCEGAEYDILYSLPIEYYERIDKVAMEFHGENDRTKRRARSDALVSHLEKMGFSIDAYIEYPPPFRGGMIRARRAPLTCPRR